MTFYTIPITAKDEKKLNFCNRMRNVLFRQGKLFFKNRKESLMKRYENF